MMSTKIFTYFGWVETHENGEETDGTRIRIVDNLSSKFVEFTLPIQKGNNVQFGSTERHVLILSGDCGVVWLYQLRSETLLKLDISNGQQSSASWPAPDFKQAKEIGIISCPIIPENDEDAMLKRLQRQFDHWNDFQTQGWDKKVAAFTSEKAVEFVLKQPPWLLACTAFGAFVVANNPSNTSTSAQLHCLYRSETPLISIEIDSNIPSTSTSTEIGQHKTSNKSSPQHFTVQLPFHVKKFCAGQDHLVLLNPLGHVYTMGTGTKGELGHGAVEKGNWMEPKLVQALAEAGIRIVDIQCGAWHTVALTDENDLYGWGWNGHGQLGYPTDQFAIQPMPYPFELPDEIEQKHGEENKPVEILLHCAENNTFLLLNRRQFVFGEAGKSNVFLVSNNI